MESKRNGKSVSQGIIQHIGVAEDEKEMEELKSLAAQIMEKLEEERREMAPQQKTLFGEFVTKAAEMETAEVEVPLEDSLLLRASALENEEDVIEGPFLAADRGMFSCARLEALKEKGLHFVLGARLKSMKASEKEAILDRSSYTPLGEKHSKNTKESLEYRIFQREDGQNLLVTWSSKRAAKNVRDREESLEKLLKKLNKKKTIPEKQLLSQRGSNRYLKVAHGEKGHSYEPDEEKIASEARWDGLFGILTDLPITTEEDIREVLSHYHSLWRIEESFRIKKHHLRIRPIFHWTESRIRGHVALQYLTFAAQRHLEKRVLLQQKTAMSPGEIREALLDIRSTLIRDTSTKKLYRFPRQLPSHAKKLLKSLGIPYATTPREILSLSRYCHRFREGMPKE